MKIVLLKIIFYTQEWSDKINEMEVGHNNWTHTSYGLESGCQILHKKKELQKYATQ